MTRPRLTRKALWFGILNLVSPFLQSAQAPVKLHGGVLTFNPGKSVVKSEWCTFENERLQLSCHWW